MQVVIGGDFDPGNENLATEAAIRHAADELAVKVELEWASSVSLECPEFVLDAAAGLFLTTGSPYASLDGALRAIRYAREHGLPFLGICGGFQHAVVEASDTSPSFMTRGMASTTLTRRRRLWQRWHARCWVRPCPCA